jgi:hypothetical protein
MSPCLGKIVSIVLLLSAAACSGKSDDKSASPVAGGMGSTWADAEKMPNLFSGMWMTFTPMTEGDPKVNVPYTEAAQKFVANFKPMRDIPYAQEGCKSPGLPIAMRSGPIKFTYEPGLLSIYMQGVGDARFIRMNQKQGHTTPKYYGNSVGHWEGDTLVIETEDFLDEVTLQYGVGKGLPAEKTFGPQTEIVPTGTGVGGDGAPPVIAGAASGTPFAGAPPTGLFDLSKAIWGPHGPKMRMVERLRLVDPETLEMKLTLYDETVWKQPFEATTRNFKRIRKGVSEIGPFSGEPEEWICTVSITSFDPETNTYVDKDPEEMVKYLDKN